jgi:hypothetical protein
MTLFRASWHVLPALVLAFGLYGCESEGPAERAGESIDRTTEQAGDAVERAGDRIEGSTDTR